MGKLNPYYVTGLVEGEGSFYVGISPRMKNKIGWEVRPSFSLSQHKRDKNLVYLIKDFFGCGLIRPNRKDDTLKYEVRGLKDLGDKIIPHFHRYSLRGQKRKDFVRLEKVVRLMFQEKHLEKAGLKSIVMLTMKMSRNEKRIKSLKRVYALLKV